jgi:hypothetical protein
MKAQNTVQKSIIKSNTTCVFRSASRLARSAPGKLMLAAALLFSLVTVPLLTRGQDGNEPAANQKHELTGNWMVTVTRLNPPPGAPPNILSLMTYFQDQNFLEESNSPAIRSTARGTWERTAYHQFTRTSTSFRFDAARNYLGTSRLTAMMTLSEDGTEFQANGVVQGFDAAGNLVSTAQTTEVGQRF